MSGRSHDDTNDTDHAILHAAPDLHVSDLHISGPQLDAAVDHREP
jgi:hypothetical protein